MGATHTVNHREDVVKQIKDLQVDPPIRYVLITHTPASKYIVDSAAICAPFGKVCSIVQDKEMPMYGTEWMAKGLIYVWELIGTKPYYGVEVDSHGKILKQLSELLDKGVVKCHHTQTLPLTLDGLRQAHKRLEASGVKGKIGLSVDADEMVLAMRLRRYRVFLRIKYQAPGADFSLMASPPQNGATSNGEGNQ